MTRREDEMGGREAMCGSRAGAVATARRAARREGPQ